MVGGVSNKKYKILPLCSLNWQRGSTSFPLPTTPVSLKQWGAVAPVPPHLQCYIVNRDGEQLPLASRGGEGEAAAGDIVSFGSFSSPHCFKIAIFLFRFFFEKNLDFSSNLRASSNLPSLYVPSICRRNHDDYWDKLIPSLGCYPSRIKPQEHQKFGRGMHQVWQGNALERAAMAACSPTQGRMSHFSHRNSAASLVLEAEIGRGKKGLLFHYWGDSTQFCGSDASIFCSCALKMTIVDM